MNLPQTPRFDGATIDIERDEPRLSSQMLRVWDVMRDGTWHTLSELAQRAKGSEAAVSARLRDLRKAKFGGYEVEREHVQNGLWRYRLVAKDQPELF